MQDDRRKRMAVDIDKMTNVLVVYNTEDAEEVEVRLRMEKNCLRTKEDRIRKTWEFSAGDE